MTRRVGSLLAVVVLAIVALAGAARADEVVLQGHVRAHDPSSILEQDGEHYLFTTGWGLRSLRSDDLKTWREGPPLFGPGDLPPWSADWAPGFRGHCWAPDVIEAAGGYRLYYSVSQFGKQTSAIGLATSPTLDPKHPGYGWTDRGVVVGSREGDDFNAIDPSLLIDDDGRHWMAFGSHWRGVYLLEIDPATGLCADDAKPKRLAWAERVEAPTLIRHDGAYYLFVNHGLCCRGVQSTYRVVIGKSDRIEGPYLDRQRKPLLEGGGTVVLGDLNTRIGPGHIAPFADAPDRQFGFHYYDGSDGGLSKLALAEWSWTDGWPEAVNVRLAGKDRSKRRRGPPAGFTSGDAPPS